MSEIIYNSGLKTYLINIYCFTLSFIKEGRGRFFCASLMCAVSNLLKVISLFLPLKVLIVMSSVNTPVYFQFLTPHLDMETILLTLILAVPLVYFLYIILAVLYHYLLDKDLKELNAAGFESSFSIEAKVDIGKVHKKTSIALSEILLMAITFFLMLFINVYSSIVLFFFVICNLYLLNKYLYDIKDKDRLTKASLHRNQVVEYLVSFNFLAVFFLLVVCVYYYSLNVFSAVLIFLLSRMVFRSLARFSRQSFFLKEALGKFNC